MYEWFKKLQFCYIQLDRNDLKNLGKNVKGLRKDDVDNISANELATALEEMKDTINDIVDDIDPSALYSMISKVCKVDLSAFVVYRHTIQHFIRKN